MDFDLFKILGLNIDSSKEISVWEVYVINFSWLLLLHFDIVALLLDILLDP